MELLQSFKEFIKENDLFNEKDKLLLAVSGGVDSVVLCELCKEAGFDFSIVHCNFQLRGEESERDEKFVRHLGGKYGVEVYVKRFETETYAGQRKMSVQEAARELRYGWFVQKAVSLEFSIKRKVYLLTAHHADDNIETIVMNFFRGTGLHGLTGIPLSNEHIRRPMLLFTKEEIARFAKENNLDYVEDSSNQSSKYTRNFFRNEIIPAISKVYPQVKENLQDNIERFNEIRKLYKLSVAEIKKKLCKQKGEEVHIPIRQLLNYSSKALVYEIISAYGFSEKQVDEVLKLANGESGSYIGAGHYRIIKHRHWFIITSVLPQIAATIIIEEKNNGIHFPEGTLRLEVTSNRQPATGNHIACLDAKAIQFPLLLRKWKAGDYFYPLGMRKKKKLARFFIDQKLSKTAKEKIWVIEMNKKITWVIGHRIDDRFKITGKTKSVLKITWVDDR